MKPTEPERITAAETRVGDVLIDKTRTVQVLEASSYPGIGTHGAIKLILRDAGAAPGRRPRVSWVGPHAPLNRLMSNTEIVALQDASLS
jgi:hypothetical protein